jgi:hypothetical protein
MPQSRLSIIENLLWDEHFTSYPKVVSRNYKGIPTMNKATMKAKRKAAPPLVKVR